MQETFLFDGTIARQHRYGQPEATQEAVERPRRRRTPTSSSPQFPDGYDTDRRRAGRALSGGQRQRIAIARAILEGPAAS